MSELEKIADRIQTLQHRVSEMCYYKKDTDPVCIALDAILRDLRAVRCVLPAELEKQETMTICATAAGFAALTCVGSPRSIRQAFVNVYV